jgi:2'-5' RNA ligase
MFSAVIAKLAREHDAPPFEPHITLHAGVHTDEDNVEALLEAVAGATEQMELICGETGHTDARFKTLFVEFDDQRLRALHRQVRDNLTRSTEYALQPHLSLLYKELPQEVRRGLAAHYTFRGERILFDHIAAARPGAGQDDWSDVRGWVVWVRRPLRRSPIRRGRRGR